MERLFYKCFVDRPAAPNAFIDRSASSSKFITGLSQTHPFAAKLNPDRIDPISLLLYLRSPSDVSRFITLVVVNPVNRMFWRWSRTNVLQKFFKTTVLDSYTSNTISVKSIASWVVASVFHLRPCTVFRCLRFSMSMLYCLLGNAFANAATASFAVSINDSGRLFCSFSSADTPTQPNGHFTFVWKAFDECPVVELLTGKIDKIWHRSSMI